MGTEVRNLQYALEEMGHVARRESQRSLEYRTVLFDLVRGVECAKESLPPQMRRVLEGALARRDEAARELLGDESTASAASAT